MMIFRFIKKFDFWNQNPILFFTYSIVFALTAHHLCFSQDPVPIVSIDSQSKGSVNFQVDDPAIYCKTKIIKLSNVPASEIEPFIRKRLSRFGSVQINDLLNQLIITEREPKLTDLADLVKNLDSGGQTKFVHLETEMISPRFVKPSAIVNFASQQLSVDGTVQADDVLSCRQF